MKHKYEYEVLVDSGHPSSAMSASIIDRERKTTIRYHHSNMKEEVELDHDGLPGLVEKIREEMIKRKIGKYKLKISACQISG